VTTATLERGGWRKLHNEDIHNLYPYPNIIRMIKPKRMRWAGHVARKSRRWFWWEIQKERDQYENLDVGGRIILRLILDK
jgi:hypothetical protein